MRAFVLFLAVTSFAGCSVPAVVHVPLPPPTADDAPGISLSGSLGHGTLTDVAGSAALTVRPVRGLGLYVSGLRASGDSIDNTPAYFSKHRLTEAGVTGAIPTSDVGRVTGALSYRWGRVESGGRIDQFCLFTSPCPEPRFIVGADARTLSGSLGLSADLSRSVTLGLESYLSRTEFTDAEYTVRNGDIPRPDTFDGWFGGVGPTLLVRSGPASFHLRQITSFDFGEMPRVEDGDNDLRLFAPDPITVQAGVSLDLVSLWESAARPTSE